MNTHEDITTTDAYKIKYDIARAQLKATEELYAQAADSYAKALREMQQAYSALQQEADKLRQQLSFVRQAAPAQQMPVHSLTLQQMERHAIALKDKAKADIIVDMMNENLPMDEQRIQAVARIRGHYDKPATQPHTTHIGVVNNHGCMNDVHGNNLCTGLPMAAES